MPQIVAFRMTKSLPGLSRSRIRHIKLWAGGFGFSLLLTRNIRLFADGRYDRYIAVVDLPIQSAGFTRFLPTYPGSPAAVYRSPIRQEPEPSLGPILVRTFLPRKRVK